MSYLKKISLSVLLFVCSFSAFSEINISDAYAIETPPKTSTSAVFMKIHNTGDINSRLMSVRTKQAKKTEMHTHLHTNDMMKMRPVKFIDIPANENVVLESGGLHLMLFDLKEPLIKGNNIDVEFVFSDGKRFHQKIPIQSNHYDVKNHD